MHTYTQHMTSHRISKAGTPKKRKGSSAGLFPDPCCLKSSDAAQILYHMLHSFSHH